MWEPFNCSDAVCPAGGRAALWIRAHRSVCLLIYWLISWSPGRSDLIGAAVIRTLSSRLWSITRLIDGGRVTLNCGFSSSLVSVNVWSKTQRNKMEVSQWCQCDVTGVSVMSAACLSVSINSNSSFHLSNQTISLVFHFSILKLEN